MLIFCMTMMFCVSCPLITPFGCMYFITKHYVDRHNIFYVYKPSKINKRVHATAISFVILSTVVLQFFMTIFRLVFTALWLPIYYLCVHHAILAGCFLLHWKKRWIACQVLLWNHPTFSKSWKCPKCISQHSLKRHNKNNLIFNTNFNIQRPVQMTGSTHFIAIIRNCILFNYL